jgi:hypothetical protein
VQAFAEFDPTAGQRVKAFCGRYRAADHEHVAFAEDRGANGKLGSGRLLGGRHSGQWVMM